MAAQHLDAESAGFRQHLCTRILPRVDDGSDGDTGPLEIESGFISRIMGRIDPDLGTDGNAEMVEEGAAGRSKHDARAVIVREDHVALDGAGRQHHPLGTDLPQPLARQLPVRVGHVVGDALGQRHEIVVVITEGRGAGQYLHVRHGGKPRSRRLRPVVTRLAVDRQAAVEVQRTADFRLLVDEHDTGTGFGGGKRCGKAGDTGANHQHVTMGITAGIMIRVRFRRRDAEAGGAADEGLIDAVPGLLRPHEGLVVEAGGKERRHQVVDRADIEGERRPAVLGFDLHAVEDFLHRGAHVRLAAGGIARDVEQRVRLFRSGRQDAARAVILERAAEQVHAVRQERRGDGIALQRRVALAVEGETGGPGRRQPTLAGDTIGAAHWASPSRAS